MLNVCKCLLYIGLGLHRYGTDPAQIRGSSVGIVGNMKKVSILGVIDCVFHELRGRKLTVIDL